LKEGLGFLRHKYRLRRAGCCATLYEPATVARQEMTMKFDAVIGHWQTRILQGVSREELDAYCATKGLLVATDRAIGLVYREVLLVKA
jgi:hypothetical protein